MLQNQKTTKREQVFRAIPNLLLTRSPNIWGDKWRSVGLLLEETAARDGIKLTPKSGNWEKTNQKLPCKQRLIASCSVLRVSCLFFVFRVHFLFFHSKITEVFGLSMHFPDTQPFFLSFVLIYPALVCVSPDTSNSLLLNNLASVGRPLPILGLMRYLHCWWCAHFFVCVCLLFCISWKDLTGRHAEIMRKWHYKDTSILCCVCVCDVCVWCVCVCVSCMCMWCVYACVVCVCVCVCVCVWCACVVCVCVCVCVVCGWVCVCVFCLLFHHTTNSDLLKSQIQCWWDSMHWWWDMDPTRKYSSALLPPSPAPPSPLCSFLSPSLHPLLTHQYPATLYINLCDHNLIVDGIIQASRDPLGTKPVFLVFTGFEQRLPQNLNTLIIGNKMARKQAQ